MKQKSKEGNSDYYLQRKIYPLAYQKCSEEWQGGKSNKSGQWSMIICNGIFTNKGLDICKLHAKSYYRSIIFQAIPRYKKS